MILSEQYEVHSRERDEEYDWIHDAKDMQDAKRIIAREQEIDELAGDYYEYRIIKITTEVVPGCCAEIESPDSHLEGLLTTKAKVAE